MAVYVLETSYTINYTTKKPIPIPEIVDALQALERIIKRTPAFIEKYYEGIIITETQVYVETIQAGSLREELLIKYLFRTKDNYDQAKELAGKILEDNEVIKYLVAMGVGATLVYGGSLLSNTESPTAPPAITAYNNQIINIGGDIEMKAQDIEAVLKGITDKKSLARDAVKVVKPAKNDPESSIEIGDLSALTIDRKLVAVFPESYEPPLPTERSTRYERQKIVIDASDRHKHGTGWGGVVPSLFQSRVKFVLDEMVDPALLHGRTNAIADISVIERYVPSKKAYEVKEVLIEDVFLDMK
ncbi:hypothetical protein FIV02_18430 [Pseudomonas sp. THAF187a]|uniref:hypothetical protein n=1 Tax=unclassified Pseudomonas TaxID=196821 RepID=UPI001268E8A6|nr:MULTISPECIES: hypothetical protein [unclassified Pseudomonas]QFT23554.1 hypothetical protein FIV02_18430 [Pseudomonas sp. THAF187a]QFT43742.1 hypothetical protein FIU98_18415 [Pseudomonas sp. THAF42]